MQADEYQKQAMRTRKGDLEHKDYMMNAALGLSGESGELADMVKKWLFQGHGFDRVEAAKELGDVLWYVALMCETMGIPMSFVMQANINKLHSRYPQGFSPQESVNRKEYGDATAQEIVANLQDVSGTRPAPHRCS